MITRIIVTRSEHRSESRRYVTAAVSAPAARTPALTALAARPFKGPPYGTKKPAVDISVTSNLPILQRSDFVYGSPEPHLCPFKDPP